MTETPRRKPAVTPVQSLRTALDKLRKAARGLPEVAEGTSYGTPALFVRGKVFARLWEDGETLVIRADFDSRDAMLRSQPKLFYLTDHYRGYPAVLVRLGAISAGGLAAALADSWEFVAPRSLAKPRPGAPPTKRPTRP